jgi:hypothetical protein
MAGRVTNDVRDDLMTLFRERVCEKMGVAPFLHQRQVWAASDGLELTGDEDPTGAPIRLEDGSVIRAATRTRKDGRARFLADLGAFKIGKSYGAALWAAGFAAVPGAVISLVGLEYDICAPEFSYICEFLLSDRGMGLKADSLQNRPRDGKMWLDLPNGVRYEARSWERKDTLKGKENDAYLYCEAYQLPGIECFTGFSQNLRARNGYAYFATTPDRPWVQDLHRLGANHGGADADPEWHCTCGVPADANPYTFDAKAKVRDAKLMTKEKFDIHYNGKLGDFVGRVFNYSPGAMVFNKSTHPNLFKPFLDGQEALQLPAHWEIIGAVDTGTFYTALLVAFNEDGHAFVLEEFPNYRYVAGSPERDEQLSIPRWAGIVGAATKRVNARPNFWADQNSQFKGELRNYNMHLLPARVPVETRTEITREYFEHGRIFLAPWLKVLPFELENAAWPEESSASGKFARVKDRDHTLDCLEHVLARRPFGRLQPSLMKKGSWAAGMGFKKVGAHGNPHLGVQ